MRVALPSRTEIRERRIERCVLELEAAAFRLERQHALTIDEQLCHLSHRKP